ncbi:MAG: YigZ family protein [Firmicutes bacterium]|nr:YigZ family protein [Bacillota bacterium]
MKTVRGRGSAEQTIEKSRFIAYVSPVKSREEAESFIVEIRAKHRDATHNVPAMVIGDKMQIQWGSDDGEPGGTAGTPMAQLLVKEGITDVAVVVTRYFGGIKLGPGGLVRAYTSSCKLGLEAAGICEIREMTAVNAEIEYSVLAKLQNLAKTQNIGSEGGFEIEDISYTDRVTVRLVTERGEAEKVKTMLSNLTGGAAKVLSESNITRKG